jgi:hypothetical protein
VTIDRLDERAVKRVSGPSWAPLRSSFFEASRLLLEVSQDACSELTTIYVKYCVSPSRENIFAVIWLKNSKQIVIGLALPGGLPSSKLGPSPRGTVYRGLTQYLTIGPNEALPAEFAEWARLAYSTASGEQPPKNDG